jgi:hypothetical protein
MREMVQVHKVGRYDGVKTPHSENPAYSKGLVVELTRKTSCVTSYPQGICAILPLGRDLTTAGEKKFKKGLTLKRLFGIVEPHTVNTNYIK